MKFAEYKVCNGNGHVLLNVDNIVAVRGYGDKNYAYIKTISGDEYKIELNHTEIGDFENAYWKIVSDLRN